MHPRSEESFKILKDGLFFKLSPLYIELTIFHYHYMPDLYSSQFKHYSIAALL